MNEFETQPHRCARNMQPRNLIILLLVGCLIPFTAQHADAQELGKPSINLVDGTTVEASISAIDAEGNVSGDGIPAGLRLQDILAMSTGRKIDETTEAGIVTIITLQGGVVKAKNVTLGEEETHIRISSRHGSLATAIHSRNCLGRITIRKEMQSKSRPPKRTSLSSNLVMKKLSSKVFSNQLMPSELASTTKAIPKKLANEKMLAVIMADLGMTAPDGPSANG